MGNFIDLTGQKFGKLTALERIKKNNSTKTYWRCLCECGNESIVWAANLRNGHTTSCGCKKIEAGKTTIQKAVEASAKKRTIDLLGQKFGHLIVIARDGSDSRGEAKWLCECDCDNHSRVSVLSSNLRSGHTQSCGCEKRSHGEIKIAELLIQAKIPFETEKSFFNYDNGYRAPFDFYVDNKYLIEYDGIVHYPEAINLHGWITKERAQEQYYRDQIKNEWCFNNNIPLIRIPYTHFDNLCIDDLKLETTKYLMKKH